MSDETHTRSRTLLFPTSRERPSCRRRGAPAASTWLLIVSLAACGDSATGPGVQAGSWVDVVAGSTHACGLTSEGVAYCWGATTSGQAGSPLGPVTAPGRVDTPITFTQIAAGGDTTCGLSEEGSLYCWGNNALGQLGNGSGLNSYAPVLVSGGITWSAVSVGAYHVCGLDSTGRLICWGGDRWDVVLGYPGSSECGAPVQEPTWRCEREPLELLSIGVYDWVEAGLYQTCAGRDGMGAECWGTNDLGQLGRETTQLCSGNDPLHATSKACGKAPAPPAGGPMLRAQPGSTHGCGLDATGGVWCWGGLQLNFGQVGDGTLDGTQVPVPVATGGPYKAVYTSHEPHIRTFSCGLEEDGAALCWGANRSGQLGSGGSPGCGPSDVPCRTEPTPVAGGYAFDALALGIEFACGLTTEASIVCWGANDGGQLGDGTLDSRNTPGPITGR